MTRLERFDNRQYGENDPISRKKRLISRIILFLAVITLSIIAGSGLYIFREPIKKTSTGVSTMLQAGIKTHFADGFNMDAFIPFLQDVFTGRKTPAAVPPDSLKAVNGTFHYTVEVTGGGRIEGRGIKFDKETVTVSDESGVKVQIDRDRVVRITRTPL